MRPAPGSGWLLFDGIVTLVLAAMIGSAWPTSSSFATVDCDDGWCESDLGRGTDCRRTPRQARHSSLSADGATVHAAATTARATGNTGVEHLRAEPRTIGARQRFFVVVTATFRVVYVFVVLEVGTRRVLHWNVTEHPTADWTAQQFRMIVPGDQAHRFVIHDRDTIYSEGVDRTLKAMGLAVLKTPARVPQANTFCERLIGTIRRECLDFVIPMNERHLRAILREWISHYNRGRPHASLGPGIPERRLDDGIGDSNGHRLPTGYRVAATAILSGLHHEYRLEKKAA